MVRKLIRLIRTALPKRSKAEHLNDQGVNLAESGLYAAAQEAFEQALGANPRLGEAWSNLAACLDVVGRPDEACEAFAKAEANHCRSAYLYDSWGNALSHRGHLSEAERKYRRALAIDSSFCEAKANLGLTLLFMGRCQEGQSLTDEAWASAPSDRTIASMSLFAAQYSPRISPQQLFAGHRRWPAVENFPAPKYRNRPDPGRRLRVGYVSSDFRYHACACFLLPLFEAHDRNVVEVYAYSSTRIHDNVTTAFEHKADVWVDCLSLTDGDLVQRILADEIDLLVDCSGHTRGNRLGAFQFKPAPIQLTWLGYPSTTGLKTMDYKISDAVVSPDSEGDLLYSEAVLRLGQGFHTYRPLVPTPEPGVVPSTLDGTIRFGAFHNLSKVSDQSLYLWSSVLKTVPNSLLVMKARGIDDDRVARDVRTRLAAAGLSSDQFVFLEWQNDYGPHFNDYARIDISVDTTPYAGTTTTCEALWMGVPVVSLLGTTPASRVGASLLAQVGHAEWIAQTKDEYVQVANQLAANRERLIELRHSLRGGLLSSTLGQADLFASGLESAYRNVWRRWCADRDG